MHRIALIIGLALTHALASATPPAPEPAPLTLAQALTLAWARTPTAQALPHRLARADELARAAAAWTPGPPALAVSSVNDRLNARAGRHGRQEWEIELSTPLWLPGQRDAQQAQARSGETQRQAEATLQRFELAGQLREAWWQLASTHEALAAAARRTESAASLLADVERRWRAGELARTDANAARAEAQAAQIEQLQAEREQRHAQAAWRALTGAAAPALTPAEQSASALPADDAHPRLAAGRAAVEAAQAQLRLAERSRSEAPELALRWTRERGERSDPYASSMGVQLRIPLSSPPRAGAERAAARAELAEAQAQWQWLREQLEQEALAARRDLDTAAQGEALARSRAALAADTLQLLQKSFALGESDLPTLLRARAEALAAQADVARQNLARGAAISKLNQALGVLP